MAKISSYPILSNPTINDILIGTDVEDLNITKNFSIGSIVDIVGGEFVPYVGATGNVNLGAFNITSSSFIVAGGLSSQFLKANGTLDSTVYVPAARTLTINSVTYDLSANRSWDLNTIDTLTTIGTSGAATYIGKTLNIPQYQSQGNYITQLSGEATAVGPGNATVTLSNLAVISKILTGLNITGGTVTDTDSILTAFGKVQNQINGLAGGVTYQGTWNAATNTPTLTSSVGVQGHYYVVSVPGSTNLNGITDWKLGDWAIFNGSTWEKVDNTDAVVSVNGYTGAVVLTFSDVGAPPATRTLSINGTTFDLTANRSWTVGDVRTDQTYSNPTWISTLAWGKITGTPTTLAGYGITDGVSSSRTLTINGTTFDLSANRTWNVGTVTSVGTSGPLTGGTITGSGTIGITQAGASSDGYLSSTDWNTFNNKQNALTNPVTGTGTIFTLPMWSGATSLVDSPLSYGPDAFNFQYNSATGGTVNFTNSGLTAYTYSIQMNNFGSPRSTVHSYTDGVVVQSIGGTQVSRVFANGNFILGAGVVDNGYKLEVSGNLYVNSIVNATTDTDRFIVSDGGIIKYRTGAEILSDIGGQGALTLTTTGTSGPSTLVGNTLNIPDYGSVLTGYVPYTGANQTVNLNTQQLQAGHATFTTNGSTDTLTINHTSGSGRGIIVTKSGNGEGLTVVKSSGSGNVASITGGITLLTTLNLTNALADTYIASAANWNTAYNNRITSLTTTGTSGAATLVSHVLNIPQYQAQGNYITSLTGEATASGPGAASVTLTNSAVIGKVLTGLTVTGSSIASTDSILTAFGKLQGQVNDLIGGLQYQGTWNASTNTPAITSGVGTDGHFYIVSVAGNTTIDGVSGWQVGDWIVFHSPAWQKVDNTESVVSVNGFVGAVTLTTSNISEGTNLYFTNSRARQAISLTTTGNSGASTYDNGTGVLNIPQYTLSGLGGVPTTRALTINGVNFDLSADRTWNVGTVTSIATTGPITGGTITGTGTIGITQSSSTTNGFLSSTDWNTFNNKAPSVVGGYLPLSGGIMTGDISWNQTDRGITWSVNTDGASIKFYNTGDGDTNSRLEFATLDNNNEYFRWVHVPAVGSLYESMRLVPNSNGNAQLIVSGSIIKSGGTSSQYLMADGSVSTLTNPVTGTGTTNFLPKFTGATTIGNSLVFDNGTNVGINTTNPLLNLQINSASGSNSTLAFSENNGLKWYTRYNAGDGSYSIVDVVNSATRLIISTGGNLGLGVTPSTWLSNFKALQVGDISSFYSGFDGTYLANNTFVNTSSQSIYLKSLAATVYLQNGGNHIWFNAPSGTAGNVQTFTQAMTLTSGGNLLVGTTTDAGFKLDVNGTVNFISGTNDTTYLRVGNNSARQLLFSNFTNGSRLNSGHRLNASDSSGAIVLATAGTDRLTIASTGAATFSSSVTATQFITGGTPSNTAGFTNSFYAHSNFPSITLSNTSTNTGKFTLGVTEGSFGIWNNATSSYSIFINSSNNVLIGTTTDVGVKLNIRGSSATNLYLESTGASVYQQFVNSGGSAYIGTTSNDLVFLTTAAGNERMRITSGGNVGIGTTAPVNIGGYTALTLNNATTGGILTFQQNGVNKGSIYNDGSSNMYFGNNSGNTVFETGGAERMRITSGGNVGIGTASPSGAAGLALAINGGSSQTRIALKNSFTGDAAGDGFQILLDAGAADVVFENREPASIIFATNTTERMRITSGGNVLIGTTSDVGATLHVNGTIRTGAPSGGSAVNWKLGTARGGTVTTNATVRVEIDGVLVDLVARYV